MTLTSFQDLLDANHPLAQPQRPLFVFTRIELPEVATEAQHIQAAQETGGNRSSSLCVDKAPDGVASFAARVEESNTTGRRRDIACVASMCGPAGHPPSADKAAQPRRFMVNAINGGRVSEFAAFDGEGNIRRFC